MSCLSKIKEFIPAGTKTEKRIAEYILKNKDSFINESAQQIGQNTETSAAAVVRFSRTMGYRGLPAMKMSLAAELENEPIADLTEAIQASDSMETLLGKTHLNYINNIERTFELVDEKKLSEAVETIQKARRVYLFGIGASAIICQDFYHKLSRIGMNVIFNADAHTQLASAAFMTGEDVCICVSYSGESREVLYPADYAKQQGTAIIGITGLSKNSLSKTADQVFYIPHEEKNIRLGAISSRNASFVIIDLLYLGLCRTNLELTKEDIAKTRKMIQDYKEF